MSVMMFVPVFVVLMLAVAVSVDSVVLCMPLSDMHAGLFCRLRPNSLRDSKKQRHRSN